jgi:hypothetical protein
MWQQKKEELYQFVYTGKWQLRSKSSSGLGCLVWQRPQCKRNFGDYVIDEVDMYS